MRRRGALWFFDRGEGSPRLPGERPAVRRQRGDPRWEGGGGSRHRYRVGLRGPRFGGLPAGRYEILSAGNRSPVHPESGPVRIVPGTRSRRRAPTLGARDGKSGRDPAGMDGDGAGGPIRIFRRRCEDRLPGGSRGGESMAEPVSARAAGNGGVGQAGRRNHERLPVPSFARHRRGSSVLSPSGHATAPYRPRPPARHIGRQRGDLPHPHRLPPSCGDVGVPKEARNPRPEPSAVAPRAARVLGLCLPGRGSHAGRPLGRDDHHRGPPVAAAGRPRPRDRLDRDASPHALQQSRRRSFLRRSSCPTARPFSSSRIAAPRRRKGKGGGERGLPGG